MTQPTRLQGGKKVAVQGNITMYEGLMAAVYHTGSDKEDNEAKNSSIDILTLEGSQMEE
jgi:hypothetical protein